MGNDFDELGLLQQDMQIANQRILSHVKADDDTVQQRCELLNLATERIRDGMNEGLVNISQPVYFYPMFVLSENGAAIVADREAIFAA